MTKNCNVLTIEITTIPPTNDFSEVKGGEEMISEIEEIGESQAEAREVSTLRIVSKRGEDKEPYTVNIPVRGDTFSLVLPSGYINWPEGKPYPDPVRVAIDEAKNLWVNFGVSKDHGFYASLKVSENGRDNQS